MHPANSQVKKNSPHYVTLAAPSLVDRLHRKIRRSKKLTKLLLDRSSWLQLTLQTDAAQQGGQCIGTLAPESAIRQTASLTCIGPALTRVDRPKDPSTFPPVSVIRLEHAKVSGHSTLIEMPASGRMVHHDLFLPIAHTMSEEDHGRLRIDLSHQTCKVHGAPLLTATLPMAAAFTDSVASNYAHWLTEVLPRIALYTRDARFKGIPLIVDEGLHPNLYESLSLIVGAERTIFKLPVDRRVFVKKLDVVTPSGYVPYAPRAPKHPGHSHGIFSAEALEAVRDACKHLMAPTHELARERIYVRRNAGLRKLVNDAQISTVLAEAGFKVIDPQELSFSEQVQLFSKAEVVVGPTGAAMANLMFCPPGSRVHVLMAQHEDMPYWYWQRLADCIGVDLSYGLGEICASHEKGFHADFTVEMRYIHELLQSLPTTCVHRLQSAF